MATEVEGNITLGINNTPLVQGVDQAAKAVKKGTETIEKDLTTTEKKVDELGEKMVALGKKSKAAGDQVAAAGKKSAGALTAAAQSRGQIAAAKVRGEEQRLTEGKRGEVALDVIQARERERRISAQVRTDEDLRGFFIKRAQRRQEKIDAAEEKAAKARTTQAEKEAKFAASQASPWYIMGWEGKRARQSPSAMYFASLNQQLARAAITNPPAGMTPSQVWQSQMNAAIAAANARMPFARPAALPGAFPGATTGATTGGGFFGRGGLGRRLLGGGGGGIAGGFVSGLLGGMGIGLGGYAAARALGGVLDATRTAVAYNRQMVAARELAGSQEQLNALMQAYAVAAGGATAKSDILEKTTRLLATGFAKSVPDIERFVRSTRGASIALGKPEEYIIQETQLAISNTSVKRLDQIGLGIKEVQDRIKQLRQENRGWTREVAFQQAVLGLLDEKYGKLSATEEGQRTGLERLTAAWQDWVLALGQDTAGPINRTAGALAKLLKYHSDLVAAAEAARKGELNRTGQLTPIQQQVMRNQQRTAAQNRIDDLLMDVLGLTGAYSAISGGSRTQIQAARVLQNPMGYGWPMSIPRGDMPGPTYARPEAPYIPLSKYGDQADFVRDVWRQSQQIERDAQLSRLRETAQYEEQRSKIIRDYAKQIAREEEDFARQRARGLRDYEKNIVEIMRDAQDRDREMRADYEDRIAEMTEDNQEKVKDIEEKYQKDYEKAYKDHRDKLLSAAGQLDAIAVLEERKRWKRENEDRKEAHDDALEEQRKNLAEQLDDARKAYEERLDDARKADAKRLEDMAAARKQQLADEDEDRAIRRNRADEDHQAELDDLAKQHDLRMAEIAQNEEDAKQALQDLIMSNDELMTKMVDDWVERATKRDEKIEKWFDGYLGKIEDFIKREQKLTEREANPRQVGGGMTPFANGGPVGRTGPAFLHAGEYVLSRSMLAAGWSPTNNSASYNSRSITLAPGAIQVQTTPGSEYMVAALVEEKMIELLGVV